jgi:hypothetical protein
MQHTAHPSQLLDSAEARAALRIGKSKLNELVKTGVLRRSAICTGRNLFPIAEVNRVANTLQGAAS